MKVELKGLVTCLVIFSIAVSTCYLFGYWGRFQINPLELISFADVAKAATYPLIGALAFVTVGFLWAEVTPLRAVLPYGGANRDGHVSFAKKHARKFYGLALVLVVLTYCFFPEPHKWALIATGMSALMFPLANNDSLRRAIPNDSVRSYAVMLPGFLLGIAFFSGRADAVRIMDGLPEKTIDIARSNLPLTGSQEHPVAYLGLLGGTHFFYEMATRQVVSVQQRDGLILVFKPKQTFAEKLDVVRKRSQAKPAR